MTLAIPSRFHALRLPSLAALPAVLLAVLAGFSQAGAALPRDQLIAVRSGGFEGIRIARQQLDLLR